MKLRNLLAAAVVAGLGAGAAPAAADIGVDSNLRDFAPTSASLAVAPTEFWYRPECRVWPITWRPYNGFSPRRTRGVDEQIRVAPPVRLLPPRWCWRPPHIPYLPWTG